MKEGKPIINTVCHASFHRLLLPLLSLAMIFSSKHSSDAKCALMIFHEILIGSGYGILIPIELDI